MAVLITRSEPGASELAGVLSAAGVGSVVTPLLDIVELQPWQTTQFTRSTWAEAALPREHPGAIVVLSAHAARILSESRFLGARTWLKQIMCVAIGEATANVLRQAGFQPQLPTVASSEGIVKMPQFESPQSWQDQWVWIFSGVGGRNLIAEDFSVRLGARLCKIAVYERVNVNPVSWDVATISAVVVASEQSLRHFAELWRARGGNAGVTVLLPSERLCAVAVSLGFSNPVNTAGADAQTLAALIGRMEQREYDG